MSDKKPTDNEAHIIAGMTPLAGVPEADSEGREEMTAKQAAILRELAEKAGEPFDGNLTRAQADERIEHLKSRT